MKRRARGTPNPLAVRAVRVATLAEARSAAARGDHAIAAALFASVGVSYIVEVNSTVRVRDGLDKEN